MTEDARRNLITAIDEYNAAQGKTANHIDKDEVVNAYMELGDDSVERAIDEIKTRMSEKR